ncbi:MAG: ABC transporter substrate-binding protein/permease [Puniceicoccales bacterium]|jgi:polar amino acid transport system substrate-binding protein|nr:ABC transporter substrate-binding protein/permease [Puniceicoccales bacterium]
MRALFALLFLLASVSASAEDRVLKWAADPGSGAPNVFYADGDLSKLCGFEKDIIEKIANIIGRGAVFCQNDWEVLIPGLRVGLYDVAINGIVPDDTLSSAVIFSDPYYACSLSLIVREQNDRIQSVLDCNGATVGVLQNAKSEAILVGSIKKINVISYPSEYCVLEDLRNGRVDAALLDGQIAAYYVANSSDLRIVDSVGEVKYSIAAAPENIALMCEIDRAIAAMKMDGSLDAIVAKWHLDNDSYRKLAANVRSIRPEISKNFQEKFSKDVKLHGGYLKMLPFFAKAATVTLSLSIFGMSVAIIFGLGLAMVRVFTPRWISGIAILIIEFLRGTPLLIQMFFVFYGLPYIGIRLSPMCAGILTLGINYSSYEAENFRAGMAAVPHGQMEAARALGMNQWQALRHVILPQAFAFILPPLTNDFIALLKDSSLVSLITIVELTRTYTMIASNSMDFFGTGAIVALVYFLIGLPFVCLARLAEKYLRLEKRAYFARKSLK